MLKSEIIADITSRVRRLVDVVQQADPVKSQAGITVYTANVMDVDGEGNLQGKTVLFYVLDEGQPTESAYYSRPPGSPVDYKAIADRASELTGTVEEIHAAMAAESTTQTLDANWETELAIMSRLGVEQADIILGKIESAVPPRVQRMIQSERGVNLADPQTLGLISQLVAGGVLTQAEADALLASNTETVLTWPGLTLWQVRDAIAMRAAGEV